MHGEATCNIYALPILNSANPVLHIDDDGIWTMIKGSSPLSATIFSTMLACLHTSMHEETHTKND